MSEQSSEITRLRKGGELQEAYRLASLLMSSSPNDDITVAYLWVLYDCLKRYDDEKSEFCGDLDAFLVTLKKVRAVPLQNERDGLFITRLSKLICSVGWELQKKADSENLKRLLGEIVQWNSNSPLRNNDVVKPIFVGLKDDPSSVVSLMSWYGIDGFTPDEFEKQHGDERDFKPFAEQTTKEYLDVLMDRKPDGSLLASEETRTKAANDALDLLQDSRCAEWEWVPHSLGKLLLDLGRYQEARDLLFGTVVVKQNESWAWDIYADTWKNDSFENYKACLFKGLSVERDIKFTKNLHIKAFDIFLEEDAFSLARAETEAVINCVEINGGKIPELIANAKYEPWYLSANASSDLKSEYEKRSAEAENILAEKMPWIDFYLEWIDSKTNKRFGVCLLKKAPASDGRDISDYKRITINNPKLAKRLECGQIYRGHFSENYKTIFGTPELTSNTLFESVFIDTYNGRLDPIKDYAFVRSGIDRQWVPPALLEGLSIFPYQEVFCRRHRTFNKNSGLWEWQIDSLELGEKPPEEDVRKEVKGDLKIKPNGFGFVGECYVPKELIDKNPWASTNEVCAKAERSWNKSRNQWGWKTYELVPVESN